MRTIALRRLTLLRFRSYVRETTVNFSDGSGLRFLSGENTVEPLGSNGSGKSSLWHALMWCCYGATYNGLRSSDLVSWGHEQPEVTAEFELGGETALLHRIGSPNKLFLNGEPIEQLEADRLLGLTKEQFRHAVIFGQGAKLFIDLSQPERAAILDDVLALDIWVRAGKRALAEHAMIDADLREIEGKIAFEEGRSAGLESEDELAQRAEFWKRDQSLRVDAAAERAEQAIDEFDALKARMQSAKDALRALGDITAQERRLQTDESAFRMLEETGRNTMREIQAAQEDAKFYQSHRASCPTCQQSIPAAFAVQQRLRAQSKITDLQAKMMRNTGMQSIQQKSLSTQRGEIEKWRRKFEFLDRQVRDLQAELRQQERRVEELIADAARLENDAHNPYTKRLEEVRAARKSSAREVRKLRITADDMQSRQASLDYWRDGFKKVRLFAIKRILTHLEMEVENAASALGLADWRVAFSTEIETKSGSYKSGVHITVSSPKSTAPWEAWSGGEAQRIRLAVSIGLARLIQRMSGVEYRFEVWDEPSAFLSAEGVEDLLQCLEYRAGTDAVSIWIADHHSFSYAHFAETWLVRKTYDGSTVELIAKEE